MKISWVVSANYVLDPTVDLERLRSIGPIWGSWKTWRACATDNVVCHQQQKARELLDRAFQAVCNFYLPRSLYESLQRPVGVKLYDGEFDRDVNDIEDIVSLHLAGADSDVVLMLGFDWCLPEELPDRLEQHRITNRHGLQRAAVAQHIHTQWVAVDSENNDPNYTSLTNFTSDNLTNVLNLLL